MKLTKFAASLKYGAVLVAGLLATGCGGGGDSGGPAPASGPSAEGVYGGTLTGSTSNAFQLLVLETGEYWAMYGIQASNTFYVAGFIQGSGTSNNGSFSSSNARDFGYVPSRAGTISATYSTNPVAINGTISSGGASVGFNGGAIAGSLYNYNAPATVSSISGTWNLTQITGESLSLNIASNGNFTALSGAGCSLTGSVTPRSSGKNVFNVSLSFGASPCALPGTAATGIAVAYPLASGVTQLLVAVTEGTRTYGAAAFGTR